MKPYSQAWATAQAYSPSPSNPPLVPSSILYRHRGDAACRCIHLNEANLYAACDRALITLFQNQEEILRSLIAGLERLHEKENHTQTRIYEIDAAMQVLRRQLHTLSSLQAQRILDAADFADQTRILNQRVSALRTERQQILNYEGSDDTLEIGRAHV